MTADRNNYKKRFGRCYYTPNRMHRELLHNAIDWRSQQLQPGALLGFDQILRKPSGLWLGLAEVIEQGAAVFGRGLLACLGDCRHRRIGFAVVALLDVELLLLLDELLDCLHIE